VRSGSVGIVSHDEGASFVSLLAYWLCYFRATRAHNYSLLLLRFLVMLTAMHPSVRQLVLSSLSFSVSGRPQSGQALDLICERVVCIVKRCHWLQGAGYTVDSMCRYGHAANVTTLLEDAFLEPLGAMATNSACSGIKRVAGSAEDVQVGYRFILQRLNPGQVPVGALLSSVSINNHNVFGASDEARAKPMVDNIQAVFTADENLVSWAVARVRKLKLSPRAKHTNEAEPTARDIEERDE